MCWARAAIASSTRSAPSRRAIQKVVRVAAETFRSDGGTDVATAITELGAAEALVSCLHKKGRPQPVQRALICPPQSQIGPITAEERARLIRGEALFMRYAEAIDRESAYEFLKERAAPLGETDDAILERENTRGGRPRQSMIEAMAKRDAYHRQSGRQRDRVRPYGRLAGRKTLTYDRVRGAFIRA